MNIMCIGDVVGEPGCEFLTKQLHKLKKYYMADLVIVNGENSAKQNGISENSASDIYTAGADVITTGNHVFKRREIYDFLEADPYIVRPANYPETAPGKGFCIVDKPHGEVCVINMMGTVFMDNLENPFWKIDKILSEIDSKIIVVDFHGEATSEKIAFASYIDGKVSAVVGTHTHVQTADERILPNGTAFITDLGMTGVKNSSLGVNVDQVIEKFVTLMPTRFETAKGKCFLCGVVIDVENTSGKAKSIEKFQIE